MIIIPFFQENFLNTLKLEIPLKLPISYEGSKIMNNRRTNIDKNYKEPSHIKTISVPRKLEIKIVFICTNYNSIISFFKKVTSLKFPEETKFIFI